LYKAGLLTSYVVPSEEGPHRKYYSLNEPGGQRLVESAQTWTTFASTMNGLLGEAA
jgi:PadR family transcriptional regulator PadR